MSAAQRQGISRASGKQDDPKRLYVGERLTCRAEVGSRVFSFEVKIRDIDTNGIITTDPDLGGTTLEAGQEILVRYYRSDSAYQFLTPVLGFGEEGFITTMLIAFPSRITRFQRRKHERRDVNGSVRFYGSKRDESPSRGFIVDLSAGGIQLTTQQMSLFKTVENPVGMDIYLDILLSGGVELHGLKGSIRRVLPDEDRTGFAKIQIQFKGLNQKTKDSLQQALRRS